MALEKLKSQIPEFAKDVRLNLSLFAQDEALTAAQKAGLALACAISSRNQEVQKACNAYASSILDEAGLSAARAAASIMAMNNVYYRFTHLVSDDSYSRMPAGLRMNVIANPGVPLSILRSGVWRCPWSTAAAAAWMLMSRRCGKLEWLQM